MAVWITSVGHFFWDSLGQSCWFGWFRVCVGLNSGSSHVQTCAAQPRWIPAKRAMGSFGITPFLTSKELSSQEGLPDFENEKHVVSLLDRAQPPLSVDTLEFLSAENELQCSPGVGGAPSLSETCPEHTAHLHPCWLRCWSPQLLLNSAVSTLLTASQLFICLSFSRLWDAWGQRFLFLFF